MKIGVIGSGISGLAISIRLAVRGANITVYEKNRVPGGKIAEIRNEGFRFDTGPSLFTLPQLAQELFTLAGERMQDWIPYRSLTSNCLYFFPDGSRLNFYRHKEELLTALQEGGFEAPSSVFKRLEESREMYELGAPVFLFSNFHKLSNFNTPPFKKVALKLYKLDFLRTMHQANWSAFRDTRLVQLFDRYATYNGSSPYRCPATLNMIAHLENNIGACFPE